MILYIKGLPSFALYGRTRLQVLREKNYFAVGHQMPYRGVSRARLAFVAGRKRLICGMRANTLLADALESEFCTCRPQNWHRFRANSDKIAVRGSCAANVQPRAISAPGFFPLPVTVFSVVPRRRRGGCRRNRRRKLPACGARAFFSCFWTIRGPRRIVLTTGNDPGHKILHIPDVI